MTAAIAFNSNWSDHGTSFKMDVLCFFIALAIHLPLFFIDLDLKKKSVDRDTERLVSVDLIDPVEEPAPPPPPPKAESSMMRKLKALVRKEPPPPPPPPKAAPQDIAQAPKPIQLQAKLPPAEVIQPKLQSKANFKTTADAKLVEEKALALKAPGTTAAPLSAKKLGTIEDRGNLKSDKGAFSLGKGDAIAEIGGGPKELVTSAGPAIAIRSGKAGGAEKLSAPPPSMADKGKFSGGGAPGLSGGGNLGLRDRIIAREAAASRIEIGGTRGGVAGGVPGGVPGGTGTKRDAGRFEGTGTIGGVPGGTGSTLGGTGTGIAPRPVAAAARPRKKDMFVITGALKDRRIERQVLPVYPDWAQEKGIEAAVVLEFTVDQAGFVKNNVVVRRTSGYPKLDDTAIQAIRQWKFVALPEGENREEVGMITFTYSLS